MDQSTRICKKCLLREMPEKALFKNMYDYIDNLAMEDKVDNQLYESRLEKCKECSHLLSGMCCLCGCYVEMRAVMKIRSCPNIPPKW